MHLLVRVEQNSVKVTVLFLRSVRYFLDLGLHVNLVLLNFSCHFIE